MKRNIVLIILLLLAGLITSLNAQREEWTFGVSFDGCKFVSADGRPEGQCISFGVEGMYTLYMPNKQGESYAHSWHVRAGVRSLPLTIFNEQIGSNVKYTETLLYGMLGGAAILSDEHGDVLYYGLCLGWTTESKSPWVALKLELQGANLSRKIKHKWKYNLNPYVQAGVITGYGNLSGHLQLTTGLTFKF